MSPPFSWTAFYIWRGLEILHVSTQRASFSPLPSCLQRLVSHLIDALSFIEPFFHWWTCGLISLYWIVCEVCLQDKFTELELSSQRARACVVLADTACRSPWGWHQPWVRAPVCHVLRNRPCRHTVLELTNLVGGKWYLNVVLIYISIVMSQIVYLSYEFWCPLCM